MGFDMFNETLEILKKSRCMLRKNIFFCFNLRHLGFGKSLLFSKYFFITQTLRYYMGFDMFNKTLDILKKSRCMLRKNISFCYNRRHLGFGKSLLFSKYFCYHSDWTHEHRNVHFGTADTHSSMLDISKNTQVNCHLSAILDLYDISIKLHLFPQQKILL